MEIIIALLTIVSESHKFAESLETTGQITSLFPYMESGNTYLNSEGGSIITADLLFLTG